MVKRKYWQTLLISKLQQRSIVWLSGVRRSGKTTLARSIPNALYFDCELLSVREQLQDAELFLEQHSGEILVLDEVHRLSNPSEILKIAADHFPDTHIIATGSSTLGASKKFRDTLTGRKTNMWLTPMIQHDLHDFSMNDLEHRMIQGGLPPFFLADAAPEEEYQEWMDDYWSKDVLELFQHERRTAFLRFAELLLQQSGGMFEATRFTGPCEVSRRTIMNYLSTLEFTYVAHVIRPFSTRPSSEIVKAPKVYGFDTGFVCYTNRWRTLHEQEKGLLWEHLVLNELHAHVQPQRIHYWRNKQGHEIDFVLPGKGDLPTIGIECKWGKEEYDERCIHAFLHAYPEAHIYVVRPHQKEKLLRKVNDHIITIVNSTQLIEEIS